MFRRNYCCFDDEPCFIVCVKPQVKQMIVEMYDAARHERKMKMMRMKRHSPIPWLHINVDLWTSKTSGIKYIGKQDTCFFF